MFKSVKEVIYLAGNGSRNSGFSLDAAVQEYYSMLVPFLFPK
jgi:hypothetical protein